ncbi:hypothetical protein [Nitrosopumilus sp.]|uniref:hypothetical protein n=1 Tax=Nitrosopumilus sp. TaxID=2024843 RepID=UPI00247D2EE3|nr:hypothetical protein [Nitrosopumilus sp.]MCV0430706.1 hypothetical protein [Nitrosopumilus sp.]
MKNEIGKPNHIESNQAKSNKAIGIFHFLDCAIKAKENLGWNISDKFMIERLPHLSSNTVRSIRKKLQDDGILDIVKENKRNNEKEYYISDIKNAHQYLNNYLNIHLDKQKLKTSALDNLWILKPSDFPEGFLMIKFPKNENRYSQPYPVNFYKAGICPLCNSNYLKNFKHNYADELDRKCSKCKSTFYHSEGILSTKFSIR